MTQLRNLLSGSATQQRREAGQRAAAPRWRGGGRRLGWRAAQQPQDRRAVVRAVFRCGDASALRLAEAATGGATRRWRP
jgi:hypothetical protein